MMVQAVKGEAMLGDRRFIVTMLLPTFFFLICFYAYPFIFNIENSFTDLSLGAVTVRAMRKPSWVYSVLWPIGRELRCGHIECSSPSAGPAS